MPAATQTTKPTTSATTKRPVAGGRLRDGPRPRCDEQRGEHAERDELAVREVHDPREPVDHGVPDGNEAVDPACRKTRYENLEREAHVPDSVERRGSA